MQNRHYDMNTKVQHVVHIGKHWDITLALTVHVGTEYIHTESYLSEKSVRCFFDCVCKWRVQMACTCLAAMFLASKCTCAV